MVSETGVRRFKSKVDVFKAVKLAVPEAKREKAGGFLLLVGSGPRVLEIDGDRDAAIAAAVKILEGTDTIVFVSKIMAKVGRFKITKDQLILTRK